MHSSLTTSIMDDIELEIFQNKTWCVVGYEESILIFLNHFQSNISDTQAIECERHRSSIIQKM